MSDFVKTISSTSKECLTNGLNLVTGGTGIADVTIAVPPAGHEAIIRIASISSGTVVVTCTGGTFDGTNNTATFNAAEDSLELVYDDYNKWAIKSNIGSVALSSV